jgi:hypothetical protein
MTDQSSISTQEPSTTLPAYVQVHCRGEGIDDPAALARELRLLMEEMGRIFDLSRLDGVTFATDYPEALRELDRGYVATLPLTPSDGRVVGIAMTPTVIRNGELKSHMLLNANVFFGVLHEGRSGRMLHLVAHECAHVELNAAYDLAFPETLLRQRVNMREGTRSQITLACWDEYAACRRSAGYGDNPAPEYEYTFLDHLRDARERGNEFIKAYRLHGEVSQIIREVTGVYGDLMKFASYFLGNAAGIQRPWRDFAAVNEALSGSWFLPYFERLDAGLAGLYDVSGDWPDHSGFDAIGDLGEEVMEDCGMIFFDSPTHPGEVGVRLPFTPETMPD